MRIFKIIIKKRQPITGSLAQAGGVASCDTSQDFGSSAPVRALPIPPPDAKLLKRCVSCVQRTVNTDRKTINVKK